VFLVVTKSRKPQALKCLEPSRIQSPEEFLDAASDLAMEAEMLSKLDHENIIQLRGVSSTPPSQSYLEDGRGYFLLMDVLEETLKDRLQRWRKDRSGYEKWKLADILTKPKLHLAKMYGRVETVAMGVAKGMAYLHCRNIILRDIKPANIGFDEEGKVRLFDFGMARELQNCEMEEICGTPRYMAPEVMDGKGYSLKSDVYSFGILLFEICSFKVPFSGKKTMEDLQKGIVEAADRPSLDCIPCPSTRALIQACWSANPYKRPSFNEICSLLDGIISHLHEKHIPSMTGKIVSSESLTELEDLDEYVATTF
jgi:serine/threonine protein kinase